MKKFIGLILALVFCLYCEASENFAQDLNEQVISENLSSKWEDEYLAIHSTNSCYGQPTWHYYFGVELGYKKFDDLPSFEYGFLYPPPSTGFADPILAIPFSLFSIHDDAPGAPYGEAFIGIEIPGYVLPCWLGNCLAFELRGSIWIFDDSYTKKFSSPFSGDFVIVLPSIDGSSSALFASDSTDSFQGALKRKYTYANLEIVSGTSYDFCFCSFPFYIEPFVAFSYNKFNQRFGFSFFTDSVVTLFRSEVFYENLYTNYYDFGGGLGITLPFCHSFFFCVNGGIYGSYANTSLRGREELVDAGGSTFFFHVKQHKEILSSKFKGEASLNYCLGHLGFGVLGKYEYWNYVPQIKNPQPGGGAIPIFVNPAEIMNSSTSNYTIEGRIAVYY